MHDEDKSNQQANELTPFTIAAGIVEVFVGLLLAVGIFLFLLHLAVNLHVKIVGNFLVILFISGWCFPIGVRLVSRYADRLERRLRQNPRRFEAVNQHLKKIGTVVGWIATISIGISVVSVVVWHIWTHKDGILAIALVLWGNLTQLITPTTVIIALLVIIVALLYKIASKLK